MKEVLAPIDGQVVSVNVKVGDKVRQNETVLAVMFAIKMEIPVCAEEDGKIKEIKINSGETVQQGDMLFVLE